VESASGGRNPPSIVWIPAFAGMIRLRRTEGLVVDSPQERGALVGAIHESPFVPQDWGIKGVESEF